MKKFITLALCLLLCIMPLGLTGCGKSKDTKVDTSIATYGNGGMVATRGGYVYFVNGYNSYTILNKNNLDKKFDVGGLYRAKLNSNGELTYDENGSLVDAEKISSRLVGFESTSIYVFGNNIYYATPITDVDKKGNLQTSELEFRKVSITGGNSSKIYRAKVSADLVDFEFYYAEGRVYLLVNEDGILKRINCFGKFATSTIAKDVGSVAMARDSYDVFESDSYKNIFYTQTNEEGKIEIYNYNVATNHKEYKKTTDYKTCELLEYKFKHLYFKASSNEYPNYTYFYRVDATKNAITSLTAEPLTKNKDVKELYLLDDEADGYITQTDDRTYYLSYSAGEVSDPIEVADGKIEIMAIKNSYIYYKESNDIKRISFYDLKTKGSAESKTILTVSDMQSYDYDIDDSNLYVYAKQGNNTYLYSINVSNVLEDEEFEAKLLGVYQQGDVPTTEE